jgi:exodeoxyribonuclease VII large subunit
MALLEERRKALAAEGLFAAERKKKLPYLPRLIGVVTSPTGAVIRDILHRLNDRFPTSVVVWPVRVQGETAAAEIAAAIAGFNALGEASRVRRPDLLIVARGGGSIEDLWAFNEEIVVRAVAASRIPVISGVGHETDTTLVDYAADHRAPTPTAAAEAAVPVRAELIAYVDDQGARTRTVIRRQLGNSRDRLRAAAGELPRPLDLLGIARQRLDLAANNLLASLRHLGQGKRLRYATAAAKLSPQALVTDLRHTRARFAPSVQRLLPAYERLIAQRRDSLSGLGKLLDSYSYKGVLDRGFALVTDDQGHIVRSKGAVRPGQVLAVEVADGPFGAAVSGAPVQRKKPRPPRDDGGQESLF